MKGFLHMMRWNVMADVLRDRPHKKIAEVGVFEGKMTRQMFLLLSNIEQYFCVDNWGGLREEPDNKDTYWRSAFQNFSVNVRPFKDRIRVMMKPSIIAAKWFGDLTLDCAFLDANHSYKSVIEDIGAWFPKVKVGGILSGHDYGGNHTEVKQAVDEIFPKVELGPNRTWWVEIK